MRKWGENGICNVCKSSADRRAKKVISKLCIALLKNLQKIQLISISHFFPSLNFVSYPRPWFNFNKLVGAKWKSFGRKKNFSMKLDQFLSILNYNFLCTFELSKSLFVISLVAWVLWNVEGRENETISSAKNFRQRTRKLFSLTTRSKLVNSSSLKNAQSFVTVNELRGKLSSKVSFWISHFAGNYQRYVKTTTLWNVIMEKCWNTSNFTSAKLLFRCGSFYLISRFTSCNSSCSKSESRISAIYFPPRKKIRKNAAK